ncbi:MAG: DUF1512 family protein [Nitrososphaerota archaeon]|jgi:hypothetical protein|nr:DUF1512 domain-containing protein [Nitrososphaerota archaeon]MDG6927401.1 DUF1512 family protein [Nitrososphaerota archaeon]MDG6931205.1 DUF1512 family protein [Nitrososphaerota archaeon]MDG6931868.1 DUF1512 family protein [Nitrososphaerota archaeon]MDG6936612.1 DUF1512 family protein [Nitrososphaerota archaeon]
MSAGFSPLFGFIPNSPTEYVLYMVIIWVPYIILIIYGQRLQGYAIMADVGRYLSRLKIDSEKSKGNLLGYLQRKGVAGDGQKTIEGMIQSVTIFPENMDPVGIVNKMELIIRTQEEHVKLRVREIMKSANDLERTAAINMLEIASALDMIYRVVRHFYLTTKKSPDGIYLAAQLQMILPSIVKQADAYLNAMDALEKLLPLGDAAGPLTVSRWMKDSQKFDYDDETVYSEMDYKGRKVAIIKAKGPGASVGKVDDALANLLKGPYSGSSAVVMIDAALKLEGEKSGDVAMGMGAAIGGIGTEKFKIEEISTKLGIPVYAVIIKESLLEAISVMTRDIAEAADQARNTILSLVETQVPEGGKAVIIGVGNTLGVAQ